MRLRFKGKTWIHPSPLHLAVLWVRRYVFRQSVKLLPPLPDGISLHLYAGKVIVEGYENSDGRNNTDRPDFFQTPVTKFVRAEILDEVFEPQSVAEIHCHHDLFEHISILDVDRTLHGWNRILKPGGLVWIQVPDFEGCVKQIFRLKREEDKEIFWRHIFGGQFAPGDFHCNGFTAKRLIELLEDYGFEVKVAYVRWALRGSSKPDIYYPSHPPLPDLIVKAIKISPPKPKVINAEWTHIAYRRKYPNTALSEAPPQVGASLKEKAL